MNLTDAHSFLVAWGNWTNAEYSLLGYKSPQYQSDYEAGYKAESRMTYPESDYYGANAAIGKLCAQDRSIIKGIYLDGAKHYIERVYSQFDRDAALRHFLNEYEAMVEA